MFKKIIAVLLAVLMITGLVGCGGEKPKDENKGNDKPKTSDTTDAPVETDEPEPTVDPHDVGEKLAEFNPTGTVEETVLFDNEISKITLKSLEYTDYEAIFNLSIENKTDGELDYSCGSVGYCVNSVNGYMVSDGFMNCQVPANTTRDESFNMSFYSLKQYGIFEIADFEIGFSITDEEYNRTYTGPLAVKTSIADGYDYSKHSFANTAATQAAQNTYHYNIDYFAADELYNEGGIRLVTEVLYTNDENEQYLMLEFENNSDIAATISISQLTVNGLLINDSSCAVETPNPGKRTIIKVDTRDMLADPACASALNAARMNTVSFSVEAYDENYNTIADGKTVSMKTSDDTASFDSTGTEVFNSDGISITAKPAIDPISEYRSDIIVALLLKNNSGEQISVEYISDTLKINGIACDSTIYPNDTPNGTTSVFFVEIDESFLKENSLSAASQISSVEFELKISDSDGSVISEPMISIQF